MATFSLHFPFSFFLRLWYSILCVYVRVCIEGPEGWVPIPFPSPYFFQIPLPSAQILFWSRLKGFKNIYPIPILTFFFPFPVPKSRSQCPKSHFLRAAKGQPQLPFYPFRTLCIIPSCRAFFCWSANLNSSSFYSYSSSCRYSFCSVFKEKKSSPDYVKL